MNADLERMNAHRLRINRLLKNSVLGALFGMGTALQAAEKLRTWALFGKGTASAVP
jgi:hypothetical protein